MSPTTDPREMRRALHAVAYRGADQRLINQQWEYSTGSAIVRQCMDLARRDGLSGEDTMTLIAYSLLVQCDLLDRRLLRYARLDVAPSMQVPGGEG
jgi:hypothetical protein